MIWSPKACLDDGTVRPLIARAQRVGDALILLTAAEAGLPVLTANRDEFGLTQQVADSGAFLYY
jgi:hypothetical protein